MSEFRLRAATLADRDVLAYQRRAMFEAAMGPLGSDAGDELEAACREYIGRAMPAGTFYAWLVESEGVVVAGGGLQLRTLMPRPGYVRGEPEALIVSMWTEPRHRRCGLGRRVLEAMLAWGRERGIRRFTLHASDDGRPLYALYGFRQTNEMRWEDRPGDHPQAPWR
jgi:GNAT superfamily N-acetyltransferase